MIIKPPQDIKDDVLREHIEHLQENAQGNALELSATPTADAPLLDDNETGIYDSKLYIRQGASIYEFTPSDTITIT